MDPQVENGGIAKGPGAGSGKLITIIVLVLLLVGALAFGGWAYSKMQDYKNHSDQKAAAAVADANKKLTAQLQAKFDQDSKSPTKTFSSSSSYGNITFNYPKTWGAYIDTSSNSEPINGYFYPDVVPGINSNTAYALRVELTNDDYAQVVQGLDSLIGQGLVTAKAYVPPKMQGLANVLAGTYISGQINQQDQTQTGNMLIIGVRDKTLEIYSESNQFTDDFNNIVLASLSFKP